MAVFLRMFPHLMLKHKTLNPTLQSNPTVSFTPLSSLLLHCQNWLHKMTKLHVTFLIVGALDLEKGVNMA